MLLRPAYSCIPPAGPVPGQESSKIVLAEIAIGWIFEDVREVMISSSSIVGFRKVAGVSDGS
jgi:hypothetical protein